MAFNKDHQDYLVGYFTKKYVKTPGQYSDRFADVAADQLIEEYMGTLDKTSFKAYRKDLRRGYRSLSDGLTNSLIEAKPSLELNY